jgi:hypothetical protein
LRAPTKTFPKTKKQVETKNPLLPPPPTAPSSRPLRPALQQQLLSFYTKDKNKMPPKKVVEEEKLGPWALGRFSSNLKVRAWCLCFVYAVWWSAPVTLPQWLLLLLLCWPLCRRRREHVRASERRGKGKRARERAARPRSHACHQTQHQPPRQMIQFLFLALKTRSREIGRGLKRTTINVASHHRFSPRH